jgi:rod shape-determining protein MreC
MPVITPDGIVGKTRDVFGHTSQVLEISDPTSGAGVILVKTRIQGVLTGNSWGQPEIVNVSPDDRIKPGEQVVTSGGDGIFPRGLAVGTVERVVPNAEGTLVNVLIKPSANLSQLEEVLVITSTEPQMPAPMQQDLNQAVRTADILAERLPSANPPGIAPAPANGKAATPPASNANTLPTPPPQPPRPIHPDRFSQGDVPPAADLVPGQEITPMVNAPTTTPGTGSAAPARPAARKTPSAATAKAPGAPAKKSGATVPKAAGNSAKKSGVTVPKPAGAPAKKAAAPKAAQPAPPSPQGGR